MNLNGPITGNNELDSYLFHIKRTIEDILFILDNQNKIGFTGTFLADGQTVTVVNGIITGVAP